MDLAISLDFSVVSLVCQGLSFLRRGRDLGFPYQGSWSRDRLTYAFGEREGGLCP